MNSIKKTLYDTYKATAEVVMPDLTNSNFIETGMLTKDEFKIAGDNLINMDKLWKWHKDGVCLLKSHVVCKKIKLNEVPDNTGSGDEYDMSTYVYDGENIDENNMIKQNTSLNMETDDVDSDDDMLNRLEDKTLVQADIATVKVNIQDLQNTPNIYDVYITYDQYYRTPRVWFIGSTFFGEQLTQEQTYKDFMPEYLNVSLTMELNPILNVYCTSVHPCKHAYAMQRMFAYDMEKKDSSEIHIDNYLVYFLKFASSVIPQLEFDNTCITQNIN
jgi:ubiquitin-like-conjugating enzyme ATG3